MVGRLSIEPSMVEEWSRNSREGKSKVKGQNLFACLAPAAKLPQTPVIYGPVRVPALAEEKRSAKAMSVIRSTYIPRLKAVD